MPPLTDLASQAGIRGTDLDWLHALISDWQLLADLSFADLVLWAPLASDGAGDGVAGQAIRRRPPTTPSGRSRPQRDRSGRRAATALLAGQAARWIALAQMRPTTAPTALPDDIVGTGGRASSHSWRQRSWTAGCAVKVTPSGRVGFRCGTRRYR